MVSLFKHTHTLNMAANIELPIDADILNQLQENHYTVVDEFLREFLLLYQIILVEVCIFFYELTSYAHLFY